jgi:FtsP/CotA-like multicopper oxidase with cupredoxin domain
MYLHFFAFISILSALLVDCAVVEYDWTVGWTLANPDGRLLRPVIAINNQWPNPIVRATKGDTIRVTARNALGNETLSFHWHGMFQNGTNAMDGPMQVTQCPILPGESYIYEFHVRGWLNVRDRYRQLIIHSSSKPDPTGTSKFPARNPYLRHHDDIRCEGVLYTDLWTVLTPKASTATAFAAH